MKVRGDLLMRDKDDNMLLVDIVICNPIRIIPKRRCDGWK